MNLLLKIVLMVRIHYIKAFLLFSILAFLPLYSYGSHLVGGEITYKFIERNGSKLKYRFTMKIYRDLFDPEQANFDSLAKIAIYINSSNGYNLYGDNGNGRVLSIPILKRSKVNTPQYPCLVPPSNIATEEAIYTWDAELKDTNQSYIITHQRCCRNATISNIDVPSKRGMTYTIEITPESQHTNNSSPVFKNFPPTLICVGETLNFDHSAIDTEGDVLVYSFCSPLIGGFDGYPLPDPPLPPPYRTVDFIMPNYSSSKPLGGNPSVSIDSKTGIMTGTPDIIGQFVVSVCVEEYRNGNLIGKIYRDFQFNTVSCRRTVVADLAADTIINKKYFLHACTLNASFKNKSYDISEIKSFYWEFDINGTKQKYSDWSPTISFRDSGIYNGRLLLNPGTICKDSAEIQIHISKGIQSDFSVKYDTCIAGAVSFQANIVKGSFPLKEWYWDYGSGIKDVNKLKTEYQFPIPGQKKVSLSVVDNYNCKKDTSISFNWQPAPPIIIVKPDKFTGCTPANVFFNNKSTPLDSTYKIVWDFGDNTKSTLISPSHLYEKAGLYNVNLKVTSPIGCYKEATFTNFINIKETTPADFSWGQGEISNLKPDVMFTDASPFASSWIWNFGDGKINTQQNPSHRFQDTGWYKINLQIRNVYGCLDSVTKRLYVEPKATFYLPNAFTPNFDTVNDEFKGVGVLYGVKKFNISIWNRWGEVVFQSINPDLGWNGLKNNSGNPCPDGVYLCQVEFITAKGDKVVNKGYVTLLR